VRFGAVTRNGQETVLGIALARINENAATVVKAVKEKLAIAQAALPKGIELKAVYDRTEIVDKALATSTNALIEGSILVAVILFLFLGEFRSAIVVIVTLPLAMLFAFICMQRFGMSANLMSLAGLAIGIGMMVDGAVVMVENAFRLLSHARESGRPINRTHVVLEAAREVANPIAFAIMIIIVVFLPLFSLTGLEGKLFKPMALTITFAMAGSLLLSLTLVPVLAALILKPKEEKDTWLVRGAKKLYLPMLDWALDRKKTVIGAAVALLVGALALFPLLGKEFMPTLQEDAIMFRVVGIPSTSLDESIRVANVMDAALRKKYPQVNSVLATIGRAEKGETADVNYMEVLLDMKPKDEWPTKQSYAALGREMQEFLEGEVQTAVFGATQPIQMRVEELISGVRATLALKVYGEDLDKLEELSAQDQGRGRRRARRGGPVGRGQQGQAADGDQGRPPGGGPLRPERRRHPRHRAGRHRRRDGLDADRGHAPLRDRGAAARGVPQQSVGHRGDPDPHVRRRDRALRPGGEDRARRGLHLRAPRGPAALRRAADGRAGPRCGQLRQGRERSNRRPR
jgi:cobalt-zinc-cadmium resistance protein CzcA